MLMPFKCPAKTLFLSKYPFSKGSWILGEVSSLTKIFIVPFLSLFPPAFSTHEMMNITS